MKNLSSSVLVAVAILGLCGQALAETRLFIDGESKSRIPVGAAAVAATFEAEMASETVESEGETSEDYSPPEPKVPVDPDLTQFFLFDGTVITGKLALQHIQVETTFGSLTVPILSIRSFHPGLDSKPQVQEQLLTHIQNLGSDDYAEREAAKKSLLQYGPTARNILLEFAQDQNVERARHVREILSTLEKQFDPDLEAEPSRQPWVRADTVVTTEFTILGKISPEEFEVESRYGALKINLSDIVRVSREFETEKITRKDVAVDGANIGQQFKNSGIRLQRGDRVSISADGTLIMTPWGSSAISTPEGEPNFGWFLPNRVANGALIAKVGEGGSIFKIGASHTFTANQSGILFLGIGIQPQHARREFNGQYNLKIKVQHK